MTTRLFPALLAALLSTAALAAPPADPPPPPAEETPAEGEALPLLPEAETPAVARDVELEELPLLVTEPEETEPEAVDIPTPVLGGSDSTVNPFSPLLLPKAPAQTAPQLAPQPAPPSPPVAEPPAPAPAPAAAPRPSTPLPEARVGTPPLPRGLAAALQPAQTSQAGPTTAPLAQALGSGTPPVTLGPAAELAAVRTPGEFVPSVPRDRSSAQQVARGYGLAVMGLGGETLTSSGSNRVSRALTALQVSFTAMATGTGIFRMEGAPTPILLTPGETLPGTELVLTRLTDRGAQFAEDDVRHTLFLNP